MTNYFFRSIDFFSAIEPSASLICLFEPAIRPLVVVVNYRKWARATSKVAPLPLLALKSSVATATRYSSSKVARYRYFTTKVAALPATATRYFEQRVNFFRSYL